MNLKDIFMAAAMANSSSGAVSPEQIEQAVNTYLKENPVGIDLAMSGATVGQTVKITAVDDKGVPTAWEPADFPSGGGAEEWELMATVDMVQDANYAQIDLPWKAKNLFLIAGGGDALATANGSFCVATGQYGYANQQIGNISATQPMATAYRALQLFIDMTLPKPMSCSIMNNSGYLSYQSSYSGSMRPLTIYITSMNMSKQFNAATWYIYGVRE